jgi:transposase
MDAKLTDFRQQRGFALARSSRIRQIVSGTFLVPSQSQNSGGYVVDVEKGTCSCPDHELRGEILKCKHRWAVEFARHQVTAPDGTSFSVSTMRVTYSQDWPSYNQAQRTEKDGVQSLLRSLCDGVENPDLRGRPGRPRAPLSDVIFAGAMKVFTNFSGRRVESDVRACHEKGLISKVPSYNTVFDYLGSADVTPILKRLVRVSATPLATVESRFAIDGTGFGSKVYKRWFDAKYGREMKEATWVKLHAICGVNTNIVTAVEVTDATLHDSPLLPQLVRETAETFTMAEVSADKGYLAASNLRAIEEVGAVPYVAFRSNSRPRGPDIWKKAFHMFAFHREEWLRHYHRRANVESTFSMIKRKFGPNVRAKTPTAMTNEVLLKVLVHNLSCLVHAIHELGVEPQFWTPTTRQLVSPS